MKAYNPADDPKAEPYEVTSLRRLFMLNNGGKNETAKAYFVSELERMYKLAENPDLDPRVTASYLGAARWIRTFLEAAEPPMMKGNDRK